MSLIYPKLLAIENQAFNYIKIFLKGEIFAFFHYLGPYSNFINVYKDESFKKNFNLFDPFCFFERMKIFTPEIGPATNSVIFEILNENFERNCLKTLDWNSYSPKIKLHEICYSGKIESILIDGKIVYGL